MFSEQTTPVPPEAENHDSDSYHLELDLNTIANQSAEENLALKAALRKANTDQAEDDNSSDSDTCPQLQSSPGQSESEDHMKIEETVDESKTDLDDEPPRKKVKTKNAKLGPTLTPWLQKKPPSANVVGATIVGKQLLELPALDPSKLIQQEEVIKTFVLFFI